MISPENWQRLRALFDHVQKLTPEDQRVYLDRELAAEPELRTQLEALLQADRGAGAFLAGPGTAGERPEAPGGIVGPYRLLEVLGEGGFGVVYLAEQTRPIQRRVALKILKLGMDTKQVIARFGAERQALALMDHPHIAQVFDAGETESGRPYFVMEYVPGLAVTDFCDRERLRIRERLDLFLQVCDAVQHAHQKGVIHRDIKPSNVLVTVRDGRPAVKVIDFGVVKAIHQPLTDRTFQTREGIVIGTLGYMSPEQAGLEGAEVDTRSDIYSLGVLLYELLVGEPPFERTRLQRSAWMEALRVIREEDPPPLATRLASMRDTAEQVALQRSVDERSLARQLRGDLEWITLRAMEREQARRYPSVSEFSADIRRYMVNQPVIAGPPSAAYRMRKFVRRHRVGVAAATFVLAAVVLGGIAAGIGFGRAVRAERTARTEAESARRVADFLVEMFQTATPDRSLGETVTARTLLAQGAQRTEQGLKRDPMVRSRLLSTLGLAHRNLGLFDEGIDLLRKALAAHEAILPPGDPRIAEDLNNLAEALLYAGQFEESKGLIDRSLAITAAAENRDPASRAVSLFLEGTWFKNQGDPRAADSLVAGAIAMLEASPRPDTLALVRMYSMRARLAAERQSSPEAVRHYLRALDLAVRGGGEEQGRVAVVHANLSMTYTRTHEMERAGSHARDAVRIARKICPPDHPYIANALAAQADLLLFQGRYDSAAVVQEEVVGIWKRNFGTDHRNVASSLKLLASMYRSAGRLDRAIERMQEGHALDSRLFGNGHLETAESLALLARYYAEAGRNAQADAAYRAAIPILEETAQRRLSALAYAYMGYANLCSDDGRFREAERLYASAEAVMDTTEASLRVYYGECLVDHASLLSKQGRHPEALEMARTGLAIQEKDTEPESPALSTALLLSASIHARAGDRDGALRFLERAARCGVTVDEVAAYPDLAPLRHRVAFRRPESAGRPSPH